MSVTGEIKLRLTEGVTFIYVFRTIITWSNKVQWLMKHFQPVLNLMYRLRSLTHIVRK